MNTHTHRPIHLPTCHPQQPTICTYLPTYHVVYLEVESSQREALLQVVVTDLIPDTILGRLLAVLGGFLLTCQYGLGYSYGPTGVCVVCVCVFLINGR